MAQRGSSIWLQGLCFACAVVVLVGCGGKPETLDQLMHRAAELPGVRASGHSKLREEFRLIEQTQALPRQLNADQLLSHQNAATELQNALDDMDAVFDINRDAGNFLGALPAADSQFVGAESGALSAKWLGSTNAVIEASELDTCEFGVRFERGYFNNLDFIYRSAAASRLLLIDALYYLQREPGLAIDRFGKAWRWMDWLAESGSLEARVQAAIVRGDALNVAEVIVNRPEITTAQLVAMQQILQHSIDEWPTVESTLTRERAMALAAYEAIRLGLTDMLFTIEERAALNEEGVYQSLRTANADQIDADEAAYLTYMREILDVASQPYYKRSKHLVECDRLLRAGEYAEDFPWFANRLFVIGNSMTLAQAEIARDRARIEGWLHLLASVTGQTPNVGELNPLNGEKYVTRSSGDQWYVMLGDQRSINPRLTAPPQ